MACLCCQTETCSCYAAGYTEVDSAKLPVSLISSFDPSFDVGDVGGVTGTAKQTNL